MATKKTYPELFAEVKFSTANAKAIAAFMSADMRGCGYGESLFVQRMREGGLPDEQLAIVLIALDSTCSTCHDADEFCYCNPVYDI